jgi:hypothetical protein
MAVLTQHSTFIYLFILLDFLSSVRQESLKKTTKNLYIMLSTLLIAETSYVSMCMSPFKCYIICSEILNNIYWIHTKLGSIDSKLLLYRLGICT